MIQNSKGMKMKDVKNRLMLLFLLTIGVSMYATSLGPVSAVDASNCICPPDHNNSHLTIVRTGENTYAAYFIDSTGNPVTGFPPLNITFTAGGTSYNVTTIGGIANFTVPTISNLSKTIIASFNNISVSILSKSPISSLNYIPDSWAHGGGSETIAIPQVTATSTKNKATGVSRTKASAVRFSENILKSVNWSKVYIKNLKTGQKCKITKWVQGNHIYISTNSKKAANTWYQVYIPASAVKDKTGHVIAKSYTWKFKTGK